MNVMKPFPASERETAVEDSSSKSLHSSKTQDIDGIQNFSLKIHNKLQMTIFKPLIPLKLTQFFWNGAVGCFLPFLLVHLRQLGLTISEISFVYMLIPAVQLLTCTLFGVIADKTGRAKPVLVANVVMSITLLAGITFLPYTNGPECDRLHVSLWCPQQEYDKLVTMCETEDRLWMTNLSSASTPSLTEIYTLRDASASTTATAGNLPPAISIPAMSGTVEKCRENIPENVIRYPVESSFMCELMIRNRHRGAFASVYDNVSHTSENECFNNKNFSFQNYSFCVDEEQKNCSMTCTYFKETRCSSSRTSLVILASIITIVFFTTFNNCYRFIDVTAMHLVVRYGKDFGREFIFSQAGTVFFSFLSGYVADASSGTSGDRNYVAAFYLGIAFQLVTLVTIWKLEVHINPPGKKMWKKSLVLLKDPHTTIFAFVILILGTSYNFTAHFCNLYLVELGAPSYLIGLVTSIGSIYGLPFLYFANWWVRKLGYSRLFLLAFLGYAVLCFGFALMSDPWWAVALEASEIVTLHLLWVAAVGHADALAPQGLKATVIAVVGTLHYGIGKFPASLIGGQVMAAYGSRAALRVVGFICLASGLLYLLYVLARRWRHRAGEESSQDQSGEVEKSGGLHGGIDPASTDGSVNH